MLFKNIHFQFTFEILQSPNVYKTVKNAKKLRKICNYIFYIISNHVTFLMNCEHCHESLRQSHAMFHQTSRLGNMGKYMPSDASVSADNSEDISSGFCCMYVTSAHSKVIPFGGKSMLKYKECAALWKS